MNQKKKQLYMLKMSLTQVKFVLLLLITRSMKMKEYAFKLKSFEMRPFRLVLSRLGLHAAYKSCLHNDYRTKCTKNLGVMYAEKTDFLTVLDGQNKVIFNLREEVAHIEIWDSPSQSFLEFLNCLEREIKECDFECSPSLGIYNWEYPEDAPVGLFETPFNWVRLVTAELESETA